MTWMDMVHNLLWKRLRISGVWKHANYGAEITEKMNKLLATYDSIGGEAMFL